jgi:hypothetical protein
MDGGTFVCYAREDAGFALTLAGDLKSRGITIWVDRWNIQPGEDWDAAIDRALRACKTLVIVLSPPAVSSPEVRGELRTALNLRTPILPVLYRDCEVPRQLQNIQYIDARALERLPDAELHDLANVLRDMTVVQPSGREDSLERRLRPRVDLAGRELRIRQDLLDDVKSEAADRLAQSLRGVAPLTILKENQPDQVTRAWDADVRVSRLQRTLPAPTEILDAFTDEATRGRLLILGAPGSGKTTVLLQIAEALVARAEADPGEPIPALFNLSSWRDEHQSLAPWLVGELKLRYGVRTDHGTKWLDERHLVPLLDGLDEVPPEHQDACVRAINAFQAEYRPRHLVVCCRLAEYENLQSKLQLNTAVRLLPLDDGQIVDYFVRAGCQDLWTSISGDLHIVALARSPLLLTMFALAYEEISNEGWQRLGSPSDRTAALFDVYIRHQLSRVGNAGKYAPGQTVRWLAWLAAMLKRDGETELLIERLQPSALQSSAQRWLYRVAVVASVALLFSAGVQLLDWFTEALPQGAIGIALARSGLLRTHASVETIMPLLLGVVAGLIVATKTTIQPIETLTWSGAEAWLGITRLVRRMTMAGLDYGSYAGMAVGLAVGLYTLVAGRVWTVASSVWAKIALIAGALAGAGIALAVARFQASAWITGPRQFRLPPEWVDALVSGVAFGLFVASSLGILPGLVSGLGIAIVAASLSSTGFPKWLILGVVSWSVGGLIVWLMWTPGRPSAFLDWMKICAGGGIAVGTIVGLLVGLDARVWRRTGDDTSRIQVPAAGRRWARLVMLGATTALVPALILGLLVRTGYIQPASQAARIGGFLSLGLAEMISFSLMFGILTGMGLLVLGAFFGALLGVLGGISGPDVERRRLPNQGILRSARNIGLFALVGMLVVGVPYGVTNIVAGGLATRTAPGPADWLRIGFTSALLLALVAGLVPGAACIQHFALRFVLWCHRLAPWHYPRFLNYATDRMFLQRVGGRYRFIHVLLRDHLATHPELGGATRSNSRELRAGNSG